jgi:hypothetical protein
LISALTTPTNSNTREKGIAVFWQRGIDVALRGMSQYYIDVDVKGEDGFTWRFTGVYGEAQSDQKHHTWQQLMNLNVDLVRPWLCAGDFDEILFSHEKEGGDKGANYVWIGSGRLWSFVNLKIWFMKGILSLGEITIMCLIIILEKGWTEQ